MEHSEPNIIWDANPADIAVCSQIQEMRFAQTVARWATAQVEGMPCRMRLQVWR
jgi:hypothetical protein